MDGRVVRRFAIGPFASEEAVRALGVDPPVVSAGSEGWEHAKHTMVAAKNGVWLCTGEQDLRDRAIARLGDSPIIVTIDCKVTPEHATVAKFEIERRHGTELTTETDERRELGLALANILPSVTAHWLAQRVRELVVATMPVARTKKDQDHRQRAEHFLTSLVTAGAITIVPGKTVTDLADRTRRILFTIAKNRPDAVESIMRMLADSKHVDHGRVVDRTELSKAIRAALDGIRYRR